MFELIQKAPTLFDWLVIFTGFASLIFSIVSLAFVIKTRSRIKDVTKMVTEVAESVSRLNSEATRAADQSALSASAAQNASRIAEQAAKAANQSATSVVSISESVNDYLSLGSGDK